MLRGGGLPDPVGVAQARPAADGAAAGAVRHDPSALAEAGGGGTGECAAGGAGAVRGLPVAGAVHPSVGEPTRGDPAAAAGSTHGRATAACAASGAGVSGEKLRCALAP